MFERSEANSSHSCFSSLLFAVALPRHVKRAVKKSFAKVLRRRMSERADGSGTRVTTAPWRTNFLAGFRAIPGLVSLGTFFASKESTSATPKALKKPAARAKSLKNRPSKPACEKAPTAGKHARRPGENHLKTLSKTSVRPQTCVPAKKVPLQRRKLLKRRAA